MDSYHPNIDILIQGLKDAGRIDVLSAWDRARAITDAKGKPEDPWKHRSTGMRCATCVWFVAKQPAEGEAKLGRCRRHAPTMNGYPVVYMTDWCGDHRLDENKAK